jgi:hypothetical protein
MFIPLYNTRKQKAEKFQSADSYLFTNLVVKILSLQVNFSK